MKGNSAPFSGERRMAAKTVNLDALIPRDDFASQDARGVGGNPRQNIAISDLAQNGFFQSSLKSLSSCQLARDLEMNQGSAWYMMQWIRAAMAADQGAFPRGIIEADETFLGEKPRKRNQRSSCKPAKRGRGTSKTAVIGAVERGGKVKAMVTDDLMGRGILRFI